MKNLYFFNITLLVSSFIIQCLGKKPDNDIVILYTNDVHCAIDDNIGYAGLSYYKQQIEKQTPYVTLVDAGDHVQGELFGLLSNGTNPIEVMNALDYDIVIPGNHEFDFGLDYFKNFTKSLYSGYISCNFRKNGELVLEPYRILEYDDVKVGFVGITTPESISKTSHISFVNELGGVDYDFDGDATGEKLVASVQEAVNGAKKEGADYIIAVGHNGEHVDYERWSSLYIVEHTNGIDAFIDGHSHEETPYLMQKNKEGKEIPITQSGTKLHNIGKVTIGKNGKIKTELIDSKKITSKDDKITKLIEDIKEKSGFNGKLAEVIGFTNFDMNPVENDISMSRFNETNIGDFIADALLKGSKEVDKDVNMAFINAGGIRGSVINGNITYGDILSILPFSNLLCIAETSGQTIMDALELSARLAPEENKGFLQISGVSFSIDTSIPSSVMVDEKKNFIKVDGKRRVHSVKVNGEPIDPKRTYKVSSIDYLLAQNGDGWTFKDIKILKHGFDVVTELLINYIKELKEIPEQYRYPQNRIIFEKIKENDSNTASVANDESLVDAENSMHNIVKKFLMRLYEKLNSIFKQINSQ